MNLRGDGAFREAAELNMPTFAHSSFSSPREEPSGGTESELGEGRAPWRPPTSPSRTSCDAVAMSTDSGRECELNCGQCVCVCCFRDDSSYTQGRRFDQALIHCTLVQPVTIVLLHLHCARIRAVIPPEGSCWGVHMCVHVCLCLWLNGKQ